MFMFDGTFCLLQRFLRLVAANDVVLHLLDLGVFPRAHLLLRQLEVQQHGRQSILQEKNDAEHVSGSRLAHHVVDLVTVGAAAAAKVEACFCGRVKHDKHVSAAWTEHHLGLFLGVAANGSRASQRLTSRSR